VLPDRVIRCSIAQGAAHVAPELWRFVGLEAEEDSARLPAGPLAVPLAWWQAQRETLAARRDPLGAWLEPHDDPASIASDLAAFALIAVRFPKFTDGRGYSIAALLRTRHGYKGELRAFGDVGRDQLFYLKRCGFDSFALPTHRDPEAALAGLEDFRDRYQGSADEPLPLFRRRHG
jgi:uncharacterized protein (DUF934 family)